MPVCVFNMTAKLKLGEIMKKIVLLITMITVSFSAVFAQVEGQAVLENDSVTDKDGGKGYYNPETEFFNLSYDARRIGKYTLTGLTPPIILIFGIKAWDWENDHDFYSKNEGWFGQGTSFGGADKAGHFFAHYATQRFLFSVYDHLDTNPYDRWVYSIGMTMGVGFLIEIGDGFSSQYGFCFQDLVMDYAGIICGALLDYSPTLDSFIGFSVKYIPTKAFRENEKKGPKRLLTFVNDYSGFVYMMNFKLAGFKYSGFNIPEFFKYIQFDLGFMSRDYTAYDVKAHTDDDKRRGIYVGVSINFAEVVKDFYEDDNSVLCRLSQIPFKYYTIPAGPYHSFELKK